MTAIELSVSYYLDENISEESELIYTGYFELNHWHILLIIQVIFLGYIIRKWSKQWNANLLKIP